MAPTSDEVWQGRDSWLAWDAEPGAEIVPEAEAELAAGLEQAEEGVAAVAAGVAAGAGADLAPGDLGADVILRAVGVQRDLGAVEDAQEFLFIGVQALEQLIQGGEAGAAAEDAHLGMRAGSTKLRGSTSSGRQSNREGPAKPARL